MPLMRNIVKESAATADFYPHKIEQSLLLEGGSYLSRTPSTVGDRRTYWFNLWLKPAGLSEGATYKTIISTSYDSGDNQTGLWLLDNLLYFVEVNSGIQAQYNITPKFRDPNSWYNIHCQVDTTQAVAADRVKVYKNGVLLPATISTAYAQNHQTQMNRSGLAHFIGAQRINGGLQRYANDYFGDFQFGEGTATLNDVVEIKNGVCVPKDYEGSYGTNGFHLDFADPVDIGRDTSTSLGVELVTNGEFNVDASGWTATGSTTSVVDGKLIVTNNTTNGYVEQSFPVTNGTDYRISAELQQNSAYAKIEVLNASNSVLYSNQSTVGGLLYPIATDITSNSTTLKIRLYAIGAVNGDASHFDNISVNEIINQGNNWTPVNLAATDVLLDSPTNKYCTLNPLKVVVGKPNTMSQGNLKAENPGGDNTSYQQGNFYVNTGLHYAEGILTNSSNGARQGFSVYASNSNRIEFKANGTIGGNVSATLIAGSGTSFSTSDILGFLMDAGNSEVSIYKNGVFGATYSVTMDDMTLGVFIDGTGGLAATNWYFNFGQDSSFAGNKTRQNNTDANGIGDFYYPVPTGALALCANNLPEPVIGPNSETQAKDHFSPLAWDGDGINPRDVIGLDFTPDVTNVKARSSAFNHILADAVRGANKHLFANGPAAEATNDVNGYLSSFIQGGYSVEAGSTGDNYVNNLNTSYISWNWKMGGAGVVNNDGSIQSTVSANTLAGQSIITHICNSGTAFTVGHGLNQALEMVVVKNRSSVTPWPVWHTSFGTASNTDWLRLNDTVSKGGYGAANYWNSTVPTSSVISLGTDADVNNSTDSQVIYAFHSVEGYSKFTSYIGNGSTDGTFIYLGFKPAYVRIKRVDSTGNWPIIDSVRSPDNETSEALYADLANAEDPNVPIDFLSNGIKIRTSFNNANTNGAVYSIEAFAEVPFKYSTAV